jgi:hypothetical protein
MTSDEQKANESPKKAKRKTTRRAKTTPTPDRAKAPPWVADPDALAVVGSAARAVGLSVEDLANLIVDAGIAALPPSDGITGRYSLKDLGTRLWGTMQEHPPNMRAQWFGGLTTTQQTAVIVTLRDRGFSSQVIAQDFKIPMMKVQQTWNKHADDLGAQVVGLRLNTIAGNLQLMAERATQGAMEKGDHATMWRITKELTKMLQEIGIIDRAIHKVEVTHKFDEEKKAELDKLLELERKKAAQLENIKAIEAVEVEGDPMPKEMQDGQA